MSKRYKIKHNTTAIMEDRLKELHGELQLQITWIIITILMVIISLFAYCFHIF